MPPKAKFIREEIVSAAFNIVRSEGMDALTARSLAEKLGSSPRPIFTVFNGMEEVQAAVVSAARSLYAQYEDEGMSEGNAFKGSGMGYLRFAAEQPKLFRLLFMKEQSEAPDIESALVHIDDYYEDILGAVIGTYGFGRETAKSVYLHSWIYTHGIASLIATGVCKFTDEEVSRMLDEVVGSIIKTFKSEGRV